MEEIKNSFLLMELIDAAKKIGSKNSFLTAEKLIVAIINRIRSGGDKSNDAEFAAVTEKLKEKIPDLQNTELFLMDYIDRPDNTVFLDDLYIRKRMKEASELAVKNNSGVLDSVTLLVCIFNEPSKAIAFSCGLKSQPMQAPAGVPHYDEHGADIDRGFAGEKTTAKTVDPAFENKTAITGFVSDIKRIRTELQTSIFGQDNAINVFTSGLFQSFMLSLTDKNRRRPSATFLFAGPPGVGKTFLAEKAAESLKLPFCRFDMSEYADKEANLEFCGSDKVYKSAKAGNVTSFVAEHPRCVLLFDEIEKAHMCVIYLFLQILDAGRLRDNYTDKEVSFTDAIIILTTNAGKQLYEESESGDFSSVSNKVIVKALQKDINPETKTPFFPAALCSRFAAGNVVMFNHITAHSLRDIAKKEINRHVRNFEKTSGIKFDIDERVYTSLLFSEGASVDARTIRSRSERFFNAELYELFRLIENEKVSSGIADIESIRIAVDLRNAGEDISLLFSAKEKTDILFFASPDTISSCEKQMTEYNVIGAQSTDAAAELMRENNVDFIIVDIMPDGAELNTANLNIEDDDTPARDFLKFLRENGRSIPVYLFEKRGVSLSEEERISFLRQGIRGFISYTEDANNVETQLRFISESLYQQASMLRLAKENKLVRFETAQSVSDEGKHVEIKLFDFATDIAVEAEDAKDILASSSLPDVHFDDVIGADEAKKELTFFVDYLKNPKKYMGTGLKPPKGVVLYGPPGTGKTMLAKAMACEAGVTFISSDGNEFLKRYVGEGSERVRELFRTARKYAPSILFVDEIEAIAKERKGGEAAGANGEDTLTVFLTEMDGFVNDPSRPVFVLCATNFEVEPGSNKSLDPALMRRFDRRVYVDLPGKDGRIRFLKMKRDHNKALCITDSLIEKIAVRATGMSLAQLDSVIELSLRSAIRGGSKVVDDAVFDEAFETFNGGEAKKWDVSHLEHTARHEAGHALLCWLSGETPSYLTIVARGDYGGYMRHGDQENKTIYTKEELLDRIRTSLGGRAAEIVYYGEKDGFTTGASADLASATRIAQHVLCTYGMDEDFGLAVVDIAAAASGAMTEKIREAVNGILKEQLDRAIAAISENKDKIDSLVEQLMVKNHLDSAQIVQAITGSADDNA